MQKLLRITTFSILKYLCCLYTCICFIKLEKCCYIICFLSSVVSLIHNIIRYAFAHVFIYPLKTLIYYLFMYYNQEKRIYESTLPFSFMLFWYFLCIYVSNPSNVVFEHLLLWVFFFFFYSHARDADFQATFFPYIRSFIYFLFGLILTTTPKK